MVEAEEGLRRPRPQRGRPGRMGPAQARARVRRGGHGVQGAEGTGPQTCWQGLPPAPRAGGRAREESPQWGGAEIRGQGPAPQRVTETTERLAVQRTKELLRDSCDPSRGPGRGGTMQGEATKALAPQKPTHHSSNSVLGWGGVRALVTPTAGGSGLGAGHPQREAACVVSGS